MTTVLAAIDGSDVSGAVLEVARTLAAMLHTDLDAMHVGQDARAQRAADEHDLALRLTTGEPEEVIRAEVDRGDVIVGVIGARGLPEGRQPAGHLVCRLVQRIATPLAVVPPDVVLPEHAPFGPVVVPVEGQAAATAAVQGVVELARELDAGLVVLGWSQDLSAGRAATVRHVLAQSSCPVVLVPGVPQDDSSAQIPSRPRWAVGNMPS